MGYYDADYEPKDTDILAVFRVTPQPGVDPIEAARRGRRRVLDRDLDGGVDRPAHRQRATTRPSATGWTRCPGREGEYIAYIAYDLDLFEEGSIANLTSSIIGNVFGFKALQGAAAGGHADPGRTT